MIPTLENIAEVADARKRAIRERAGQVVAEYIREGEIISDEELFKRVVDKACKLAHRAGTAQAAVQWAMMDLTPWDVLEPTG